VQQGVDKLHVLLSYQRHTSHSLEGNIARIFVWPLPPLKKGYTNINTIRHFLHSTEQEGSQHYSMKHET